MKFFPLLAALFVLIVSVGWSQSSGQTWTIAISGNTHGYLTPCGCTKPMAGGIRRRNTILSRLSSKPNFVYLDAGNLVLGTSRQDVLKAEALAEALGAARVSAVAIGPRDFALGLPVLGSIARLTGEKLLSQDSDGREATVVGPFAIVSIRESPLHGETSNAFLQNFLATCEQQGLVPILLICGSKSFASSLANRISATCLVVYSSIGSSSQSIESIGSCSLVTPGDKGRDLLTVQWSGQRFTDLKIHPLGPEVSDDPRTSRIYEVYQGRVRDEKLLELMPRLSTPRYAGFAACASCHGITTREWQKSKHASALKTLESEGVSRDPDCVGCHVTGLESRSGYFDRASTPKLANVGCESCHGPSYAHAKDPKVKTPENAVNSCQKCHDAETSPNFRYSEYWKKIQHR